MNATFSMKAMFLGSILLLGILPWRIVASDPPGGKAVVPPSAAKFSPVADQAGNAALFVGINEFTRDPSLTPLHFAVNDAVAMAHLFCIELQIIPPNRTYLALAGKPDSKTDALIHKQLEALKEAGVRVVPATRTEILTALLEVAAMPQNEKDLLVVFMSSHGFEDRGIPFVMPSDGWKRILFETGLNLTSMESMISDPDQGTKAGKKLLILDACREKAMAGSRGDIPMGPKFLEELGKAKGQAVLASCAMNQLSFEDPGLRQGVFVNYLLEGLRGKAATDPNGFIRLEQLLGFVKTEVAGWAQRNKKPLQAPSFKGAESAREIPLALDANRAKEVVEAERQRKEQTERWVAKLNEMRRANREVISLERLGQGETLLESAESGLGEKERELRDVYLDLVEGRITPRYLEGVLKDVEKRFVTVVKPTPREEPPPSPPTRERIGGDKIPPVPDEQKTAETKRRPSEEWKGKTAPQFRISTLGGLTLNNSKLGGARATVLNFVAPNCGFCKKQVPWVENLRKEFESKGVRFVNVAQKMGSKEFSQEEIVSIFSGVGSRIDLTIDKENVVGQAFNASSYPTLVVIDKNGDVHQVHIGAKPNLEVTLRGELERLLQQS